MSVSRHVPVFVGGLALAAVVFAPGGARALNECGALASGAATCSDQAYANGIQYNVNTGWEGGVAGDVALTVTGGPATTITARPHNVLHWERGAIIIRTAPQGSGDATTRNIALTVGAGGAAVAIRERSGADSDGVNIAQHGKAADGTTVTLGSGVTIGTESAPMSSNGVDVYIVQTSNSGDHGITSAATIHSVGNGLEMAAVGPGDFAVTNTGSITVAAAGGSSVNKNGILFWQWEHGSSGRIGGTRRTVDSTTTITNAGSISVAAGQGIGIDAMGHGLGLFRIVNSGGGAQGITASGANGRGIYLDASHHTGAVGSRAIEVENSGRITTSGAGGRGIWVKTTGARDGELQAAQHKGDVSIANSGSISSASHAVFVDADMGAVSVTHSGGAIASTAADGIRVQQGGTGDAAVTVSGGATLTSKQTGIHADLSHADNAVGRVKIVQGGTIEGRKGVYARVGRASAEGEADVRGDDPAPLIDVAWTGTFTQAEAGNGAARAAAGGSGGPVAAHDEVPEAETAQATRHGTAAGIEAHVLSWRDVAAKVAEGDDPGMFADAAAVAALFAADADADMKTRAAAAIASFRAQLTSDRGAIPDVDSVDANNDDEVTDAEITAFLSVDDADRRTFLRNILREHLSAAETAVLRAVVTNTGLDAALDAGGAIFSDDYKTAVRAFLDRHNPGDIRIAVGTTAASTTGSIVATRGDGIRAYYATPNDDNGAIAVTVAAGTTVTGGAAGIYVANAGATGSGAARILKQTVTVNGMVTGGTDAAVHLVGGGKLTVGEGARVLAGSSGRAILVNEAGRSEIVIHGLVRGGTGGDAAVRLSGGGTVTIGRNGRVEANGATNAILADEGTTVATLRVEVPDNTKKPYRDEAAAAVARVKGNIVGVGDSIVLLSVDDQGRTGMAATVTVSLPIRDGRPDTTGNQLEDRPPPVMPDGPDTMLCGEAVDGRCRLYEALPSALLSMNGLPTYRERMSSARGGNGGWARFEAASGKWKAARSTQDDVSYNRSRTGVRAGVDMAVGEEGLVGLSAHGLTGSAKMTGNGGKVTMTGIGMGINATARTADGIHVDGQLAVTRYKAKLTSGTGTKLQDGAKGTGYALALEAGRSMSAGGGVSVTPRAGLAWSQVSLRGFTDTQGTAVAMKNAGSFTGGVGVDVETAPAGGGPVLFGSLDVTREFTKNTETRLPGTMLKATAAATSLRVGVGARFDLGDGASMLGTAAYETAGRGNNGFGGALSFTASF